LVDNPEESIAFLNAIEEVSPNKHIDLDVDAINVLSPDAILALVATIGRPKFDERNVRGNLPKDPENQQIFIESGFFDHVHARKALPRVVNRGLITQRRSKKVESGTAAEVIHHGTKRLTGQSSLVEAMGNTHNHAAGSRARRETWWAMAYADSSAGKICYSFVDTGVGIFRSLKLRPIKRFYNAISGRSDAHILADMLDGKVESSTGLPYRGRGLPSMKSLLMRGDLKRLVILTNNVYADVGSGDFRMLKQSFHGTLLYWEIWVAFSIDIAKDFSTTPGPRYAEEGDFSGELFREKILVPKFDAAETAGEKLDVYLNGTEGYATSFLEEAFGGLARQYSEAKVLSTIVFHCDDDPYLVEEITGYVNEANAKRRQAAL
jgi:STAS-like domain of unknown function (DUF4325)